MADHNAAKYMLEDEYGLIVEEIAEHNEEVAANLAIRTSRKGAEVREGTKVILYWVWDPKRNRW